MATSNPRGKPSEPKKLTFGDHKLCPHCRGKGTKKGDICGGCNGRGYVKER